MRRAASIPRMLAAMTPLTAHVILEMLAVAGLVLWSTVTT